MILPFVAVGALVFAVTISLMMQRERPRVDPPLAVAQSQFGLTVAGVGLVEPRSELIAIGTPIGGIVESVAVKVGDEVEAGEELFRIDSRSLKAELASQQAAVALAKRKLAELEMQPRAEAIPPLVARVEAARAALAQAQTQESDARDRLKLFEQVTDKRAISVDEMDRRRFALAAAQNGVAVGKAQLAQAEAELALVRAGTYGPVIEVARAELASAEAELGRVQTELDRLTVRAPITGQVLQVKVRVGEFAPGGVVAEPLMVMGDVGMLHVRVDIDQTEAARVAAGAKAVAHVRGQAAMKAEMKFVRFEPLVVPKRSLTGDVRERVDTRVLQVIYAMEPGAIPVRCGQQVDVFIETAIDPVAVTE
jgi:multidrug resistance efflux pump